MNEPVNRFDLWGEQARIDPLPILARMRAEAPVVRLFDPHQGAAEWVVTRYADVAALLKDPRFTKDKRKLSAPARERYFRVSELDRLDKHMLFQDPPDHTRLKALVVKAFTPRHVAGMRPRVAEITHRLIDEMTDRGSADLLQTLAFRLPAAVITEMIGVPVADRERFQEWTRTLVAPPANGDFESLRRMAMEFQEYLDEFLRGKRARPGDDLTSALIAVEERGDRLSDVELMSMVFLLLAAGYETTGTLIGNSVWSLLRHPDQLDRLRADPSLLEPAIEEVLRYCSPVKNNIGLYPLTDIEFGGQVITAEEKVVTSLLSANHDPDRFHRPERFDIFRAPNRHLAFGFGPHFCLGAPLARLEAAVAVDAVLRRFPRLRFAEDPTGLRWRDAVSIHGLDRLPVTW